MDRAVDAPPRVVKLLTALVALAAVLVAMLGAGGLLAWREYARLRGMSHAALGERSAVELLEERRASRQRAVERLAAMGKDARRQIATFEKRAGDIRAKGGGPIDSAEKALDLAMLMMDQSLFALKQTAALQDALVKGALPLATEGDDEQLEPSSAAPRSARRPPAGDADRR
jgi:hypothetical protein